MNKEKTRGEIIQEYIEWYISGATISELQEAIATQMWDDLDMLSDAELVRDVRQYAPHIVDNMTLSL